MTFMIRGNSKGYRFICSSAKPIKNRGLTESAPLFKAMEDAGFILNDAKIPEVN